jgi:long-chain acyl-CoA synthetase
MLGYWKQPEATAEALRDGWMHTGDMGSLDQDGYLSIVDRKKDMIISGGENVDSAEVESVLYQHPTVLEAAVIGIPDSTWGETVKAIVVHKAGQPAAAEDLQAFCRHRLAGYKVPRTVDFVENLAKTATGKINKHELSKSTSSRATMPPRHEVRFGDAV